MKGNMIVGYEVRQVVPGFYWIDDCYGDSIYLIEGREKALVVDTGMADNDFAGMIRSLTKLPVELAVTHNHKDHMLHLDQFEEYYMNEADVPLFESNAKRGVMDGKDYSACRLLPIRDKDRICLGGDYEIEVFEVGGHTPGSVAFLDVKRKIMMTGDALGGWMHVPGAMVLSEYQRNLVYFLERLSAPEYEGIYMFTGHNMQMDPVYPYLTSQAQCCRQKVKDLITLCRKLLLGEIAGEPFTMRTFGKAAFLAEYGRASIVYDMDSLK